MNNGSPNPNDQSFGTYGQQNTERNPRTAEEIYNRPKRERNTVIIRRFPDSEIFDVHKQGLIDGVMEVPEENYPKFQKALENELTTNRYEIERLNKEIADLEQKIVKNHEEDRKLHEQRHSKEAERDALEHVVQELESKRQKLEEERNNLADDIKKYEPASGGWSVVLLMAAAIAFVVGEIIVNIKIVADAFGMEGWQGKLFAAGLAAVSVLLKPAYDRLLEKPYLEARPKITRGFIVVMVIVSVLSLMTAYLLGEFRFDTEALNKISELDEYERQRLGNKIVQLENELTIESMTGWVPKFSFILAAILFAIGGTVCLSIALTAIEYRQRKNKLEKRLTGVKSEITETVKEIGTKIKDLNDVKANVKTLNNQIEKLPKTEELEKKLSDLNQELVKKAWKAAEYEQEEAAALYKNAYERGKAIKKFYQENPEIWGKFYLRHDDETGESPFSEDGFINIETIEPDENPIENKKFKRRTPVRPYQALKLAIGAKFRDDCRSKKIFDPSVRNYDVEV